MNKQMLSFFSKNLRLCSSTSINAYLKRNLEVNLSANLNNVSESWFYEVITRLNRSCEHIWPNHPSKNVEITKYQNSVYMETWDNKTENLYYTMLTNMRIER